MAQQALSQDHEIIRRVRVDRTRTPQKALRATRRRQCVTDSVATRMPKGAGDDVEVHFFKLGYRISNDDLEREYEQRGLRPADPYSLAAVNEADPRFADTHPNSTHWKDASGQWYSASFTLSIGTRVVDVHPHNFDDWLDYWWFAGVRA